MAQLRHLISNPEQVQQLRDDLDPSPDVVRRMSAERMATHLEVRAARIASVAAGRLKGKNPFLDDILDQESEEAITRELRTKLLYWKDQHG